MPQGVQFFKGKILQHISPKIILANPISSTYWQFTFDDPNGNIIYTQTIPAIADETIAIELNENHLLLTKPDRTEFSIYVSPIGLYKYITAGGNSSTISKFTEYEISSIDSNTIKTLINR